MTLKKNLARIFECFTRKNNHELNTEDVLLIVEHSWSDNNGVGLSGWVLGKKMALEEVSVTVDNMSIPITTWYPRPDIQAIYPDYPLKEKCGFSVYIPRQIEYDTVFSIKSPEKTLEVTHKVIGSTPHLPPDYLPPAKDYYREFANLVNENKLHVLEIGSRIVSPGSASKRSFFPQAASYTGFDYYPDANTDVTGDAHRLSHYFSQRFDAIFSVAVLEHLAMPWVIAKEINKLLPIGGITYHLTVFAWPRHDAPWDFWRFSDDGLKVLFSPSSGFEVINAGLAEPLRMSFDKMPSQQEQLPFHAGFATSWVFAKKIAEIEEDKACWDFPLEEILGKSSCYPTNQTANTDL